jgi:hypothetical protein
MKVRVMSALFGDRNMKKIVGMALILIAMAVVAIAKTNDGPEIDPGSAASALALLAGAALIIRARFRKN